MQINLLIFIPAFPLGRVAGAAALGRLEMRNSHSSAGPHQDRTKEG